MELSSTGYKNADPETLAAVIQRCTRIIDNPEAKVSATFQAKVIALRDALTAELDSRAVKK